MSIEEEYNQIISRVESILENKRFLSPQQIGTNIVNAVTPSHYDTISEIYKKYPEIQDLEGAGADIEIMSDNELWPTAIDEIKDMLKMIKNKYNVK